MSTRKSATQNGFLIFTDQLDILENIPDENVGKAIKLLLKNFNTMEHISEDALTNTAYELIATNIRRYRAESEQASEYGKKGGGNPTLNPTYIGTYKGTLKPTYKQQNNTIQDNTIQEINRVEEIHTQPLADNQKLYGEYLNVCLTKEHYGKLEAICLSKELLNTVIDELSEAIEIGRYDGYKASHPQAHYVLLQRFIKEKRNKPIKQQNKPYDPNACLF